MLLFVTVPTISMRIKVNLLEFDPDDLSRKSVLRNSVPEIILASSSKDASSEWHYPCPGDCTRADLFYNHHTNSKMKFIDLWSKILQMVE